MSNIQRSEPITLSEYTLDDLGTSFKVVLVDSVERRSSSQGPEVYIPDFQGLMKLVAISRAKHPMKLKGGDIKFLRKNLGMRSKDLAMKLDISPEHMSRCESGDKALAPNSEKVLRSLVLLEAIYVAKKALDDANESNSKDIGKLISKLTDLIDETKEMMEGLTISPLHSIQDEVVFHFHLVKRQTSDHANDQDDDSSQEWLSDKAA
jgi:DNA-binding transcriptional regulator YiaG